MGKKVLSFLAALMKKNRKIVGFVGAICSLAVVYAASSAPIPLYTIYRQAIGFTSADFSLSAVAYFAGTVMALLMLRDCQIIWAVGRWHLPH